MRRTARWCAVAAAMALAISPTTTAIAGTSATSGKATAKSTKISKAPKSDIRDTGVDYNGGKALPFIGSMKQVRTFNAKTEALAADAPVGTVAQWLALDDLKGIYRKNYVLKGVGEHIQIWVASDADGNEALQFPAGDCRNTMGGGAAVTVTQEQVDSFVSEFDNNMFPKESEAFSVAPDRDGTHGAEGQDGPGNKTVTLIDNVRDANYYTPATPDGQTYIAGFFFSVFNELTDRNIMTIDSFDWLHRTGATPPDNTADADYAACAAALGGSRPFGAPRPRLYEGTFAHEYQHLLEYYQDTDEVNWINEGLSDWAQSLVGYVDTNKLGTDPTADSHIACFQGYIGENFGGPENSLTQWEDQGGPEVLCDYGAAYSMMEYLHGRFGGDAFMSALHKEPGNGLVGLQNVLDAFGFDVTAQQVVHDWQTMMALDHVLDGGQSLTGGTKSTYRAPTLASTINFDSPQAFNSPGAPPNGADYVRARDEDGNLSSDDIFKIDFKGAKNYPTTPVEWTVQGGRLFSGAGDDLDRGISRKITVPKTNPTLTADVEWGTELAWDFAYVQVFDPATKQWVSLKDNEGNATSDHDPGAAANVVANLPGLTGPSADADESAGVHSLSFDLSKWKGKTIDIAFRYITDGATTGLGYWVDNVAVGGTPVSDGTDLSAWQSLSEAHPEKVAGWTVQLIGYSTAGSKAFYYDLPLRKRYDGQWVGELGKSVQAKLGTNSRVVAALVTPDDPTETATSYPDYALTVNRTVQPGGGR